MVGWQAMKAIFGLGNPDKKFAGTRHNIGRQIIGALQEHWRTAPFTEKKKLSAALSDGMVEDEATLLAYPLTYMNQSGIAVKAVCNYYDIAPEQLIVVHDDSDITFGDIKTGRDSGSAGHKGVRSVIEHLGTTTFVRVRIGIRPAGNEGKAETFVLSPFTAEEREELPAVIEEAVTTIEHCIQSSR